MKSAKDDEAMQEEHLPYWQAMIDSILEKDLAESCVLDFGCNQGGFLRLLYEQIPFKHGVGIDAVQEAIALAKEKSHHLPLDFHVGNSLTEFQNYFNLGFSHEVLYLLEELNTHAYEIFKALKPCGSYYTSLGAHLENPLWPKWRSRLKKEVTIPPQDYSVEDIVGAFKSAGFQVTAKRLRIIDFHPYDPEIDQNYFPNLMAKLEYFDRHKILFRFVKAN